MKTLGIAECLLWLVAFAGCGYRENPLWDDKPTQSPPAVPEMNELIRGVHGDLLKLREQHQWLAEYGDKFLYAGEGRSSVYYYPRWGGEGKGAVAQQPDHLLVIYLPIDAPKKGKYSNDFEDEDACRFPALGAKIYGGILCRSEEAAAIRKAVRDIVLANCAGAQEALKAKPAEPAPVDRQAGKPASETGEQVKLIRTFKGHQDSVRSLAFSPDSKKLVSGDGLAESVGLAFRGTARLWDVQTGKEMKVLKGFRGPVRAVAFSPDGQTVAAASYKLKIWNLAADKARELPEVQNWPGSLAFSPDGKMLAAADGGVSIWDTTAWKQQTPLVKRDKIVSLATFSPDGKILATCNHEGLVRAWDVATWKENVSFKHGADVHCLLFSPDSKRLFTAGSYEAPPRFWDAATGKKQVGIGSMERVKVGGLYDNVVDKWEVAFSAAISPDGRTLATGTGGDLVKLWDASTGKLLASFAAHHNKSVGYAIVDALAFSPDGTTLASGGSDGLMKLWDVSKITGRPSG